MAMENQAELVPGEQEGPCWGLWVWGVGGLPWWEPRASPGATAPPCSPLSALGSPRCREQAVPANRVLELLPEKPPEGWARAEWRVTLGTGHQLRVLTAEKNKDASLPNSSFAGRAAFKQDTLSLRISPVSTADSGVYRLDVENAANSVIGSVCFRVSVWEPVRQPRLEARVSHQEQGWCNVSLVCTVPGAGNVSYSWFCPGEPLGALEQQPRLDVLVRGDGDPKVCSCNVSNPASWSTASTDPVAACRRPASGLLTLVVVAVALVLALAISGVVTFCWWRKRGKDPQGEHAEQSLTVYEEVGKTHTAQHPNATSEATVGGNTIYAVICPKTQGSSHRQEPQNCTIYTTVQPTRKSPSLKRKKLDRALVSTAYVETTEASRRWRPPLQTSSPSPPGQYLS
ncbi:natural killer cell receptor 2B4-like isoform X2 [Phalacrocorax carbo]|uniref:natural killer cell receptor 2B4-like isoform X2 n=1 Tax=Phalacrocorax carbo TaxID=9209 RepID=UPI003119C5C4